MNNLEELNVKTIKDIRDKWPKHFPDEHKPVVDGVVVSISLGDSTDNFIVKYITIMEPNGTEWNITMCGDEVIDYGINMPEDFLNKSPVDLSHLEQWGPKLLEPEPKKVIHRRIILD